MKIWRAPLRITLGGGGSDLAQSGVCINMAINVYTYVAINPIWDAEYSLHYSAHERVATVDDISHRLFRRTFQQFDVQPGVEITTMSDVPASSGLGSSGAFTVALCRALNPTMPLHEIVHHACQLDTGMQDQYAAAYGGLNMWRFSGNNLRNCTKERTKIDVPSWFFGLALYDTGLRRDANTTLRDNPRPADHVLIQQAHDMRAALADPTKFSDCLNAQWAAKYEAAPTPIHRYIDHQIRELRSNGAWGAKLIGAGDGGMILTFSQDHVESDLRRIPIKVDAEGVVEL